MKRRDVLTHGSVWGAIGNATANAQTLGNPIVDLTFGTRRPGATVRSRADLCQHVYFHDQFNQRNNGGGKYLADNMTPPECLDAALYDRYDADWPFHEVMPASLRCYVRPKQRGIGSIVPQPIGTSQPLGGSGFRLKYSGPGGMGSGSGRDLRWEVRCRMSGPLPYFWWALWMSGEIWDEGAELDVPESFGFDNGFGYTNYHGELFHANSVGGTDEVDWQSNWTKHTPTGFGSLTQWHTFTTVYRRDDTWDFHVDGRFCNRGRLLWNVHGNAGNRKLERCWFLIDNNWGHQEISSVRPVQVDAKIFENFFFEYDYIRIWMSD